MKNKKKSDWEFREREDKNWFHKIHNYPATFPPQLAEKLIKNYSKKNDLILDIFCGSGTSLLESQLLSRNALGFDLNPLAIKIAKVKTSEYESKNLRKSFEKLKKLIEKANLNYDFYFEHEYWFKKNTYLSLKTIKKIIDENLVGKSKDFYLICLSQIVRQVSLLKHSGFKMHKDKSKKNSFEIQELAEKFFFPCVIENIDKVEKIKDLKKENNGTVKIFNFDARLENKNVKKSSVDLILTSPPYGDSQTTVAYGEFSKLPSEILDIGSKKIKRIDNLLLGGTKKNTETYLHQTSSREILNLERKFLKLISEVSDENQKLKVLKRFETILSFYKDLEASLKNCSFYLKPKKYLCIVMANRTILEVELKTDKIIKQFLEKDFEFIEDFKRNILKKRMPSFVNAKNVKGTKTSTMTTEKILIFKKI